jgi:hypothetical protein
VGEFDLDDLFLLGIIISVTKKDEEIEEELKTALNERKHCKNH